MSRNRLWMVIALSFVLFTSARGATYGVDVDIGLGGLLSWRAATGKKYTVMKSANLLSNDWNTAAGTLIGVPGDMSAPAELEFPGFYRLDIEP